MTDIFEGRTRNLGDPGFDGAAVTSSDDNDLATTARCLYIGGAGNVAGITAGPGDRDHGDQHRRPVVI